MRRSTIYTYSEVEKVSGFVGDFTVDIRKKARSVDMDKCTGCGVCSSKVSVQEKSKRI